MAFETNRSKSQKIYCGWFCASSMLLVKRDNPDSLVAQAAHVLRMQVESGLYALS